MENTPPPNISNGKMTAQQWKNDNTAEESSLTPYSILSKIVAISSTSHSYSVVNIQNCAKIISKEYKSLMSGMSFLSESLALHGQCHLTNCLRLKV